MDLHALVDRVVVANFEAEPGNVRKAEMWNWIPDDYDLYVFLDTDTVVLDGVEFAMDKARGYGMAIAPAAHYCLDAFWGFDRILAAENVPARGQLLYNSGVIFFTRTPAVESVFRLWFDLARKHGGQFDQPFLTLAMELQGFRPYVLSPNYNYREMRVPISGKVRIWHSRNPVPPKLNADPRWWPMRYVDDGILRRPGYLRQFLISSAKRLVRKTLRGRGDRPKV